MQLVLVVLLACTATCVSATHQQPLLHQQSAGLASQGRRRLLAQAHAAAASSAADEAASLELEPADHFTEESTLAQVRLQQAYNDYMLARMTEGTPAAVSSPVAASEAATASRGGYYGGGYGSEGGYYGAYGSASSSYSNSSYEVDYLQLDSLSGNFAAATMDAAMPETLTTPQRRRLAWSRPEQAQVAGGEVALLAESLHLLKAQSSGRRGVVLPSVHGALQGALAAMARGRTPPQPVPALTGMAGRGRSLLQLEYEQVPLPFEQGMRGGYYGGYGENGGYGGSYGGSYGPEL